MTTHHKIELQQSSSGAAMEMAAAAVSDMCAVRDAAVDAVLKAAAAEYAQSARAAVLRDRFNQYVARLRMDKHARLLALYIASIADIGASGLLEARYTFGVLADVLGIDDGTVSRYLGVQSGGLESSGLIEAITRGGSRRSWHVRLTIGAGDADLPAQAVAAFSTRVRKRAGLVGA